jgi:hypothetical protein
MPYVPSNQSMIDQLQAFIDNGLDAAGPVHATIKLAQGSFAPGPTSDPTTFTEADFDGYASKTVAAWEAAALAVDGTAETISSAVQSWAPTGTTTPNTITGYWVIGGNGHYLGGEAFATPVVLNSPSTRLNLVPAWKTQRNQFSAVLIP